MRKKNGPDNFNSRGRKKRKKRLARVDIKNMQRERSSGPSRVRKKTSGSCI